MALARYEGVAVNLAGDVIPNATVEVRRDQPGRPVVPLFSDREGTIALGNPITTDAEGKFGFHAPGGVYYIRVFTGPSQQPLQQYVRRYQPIGTAAERDVEDLASALEAGTASFRTVAELQAFTPSADEGIGGKVTTGEGSGFYHYDPLADEGERWVFDRALYDTLAVVTLDGTAPNAQTGMVNAQVNPAGVVEFIAYPSVANTGPMTLSHDEETPKPVLNYAGNPMSAGEWATFVHYRDDGLGNYRLTIDANAAAISSAAATTATTKAAEATASATLAAGYAAGVNIGPIMPGDAGKVLTAKQDESGSEWRDAPAPDVTMAQTLQFYATIALEQAEDRSSGPVLAGPEGSGLFDGFNVTTYIDLANSDNIETAEAGVIKPEASAAASLAALTMTTNFANNTGYNMRIRIAASQLAKSGSRVRLKLRGVTSGTTLSVATVYIGHKAASGDAWDMDGSQVAVTVGGLAAFSLPAGTFEYSDWVDYALDETRDLIVSFYTVSGDVRAKTGSSANFDWWLKQASNETSVANVSGYTESGTYEVAMIEAIDVEEGAAMLALGATTPLDAVPDWVHLTAFVKPDDAVINDDLVFSVSRDGLDFLALTMTELYERPGGSKVYGSGKVSLAGIDSGSSGKWQVQTGGVVMPKIEALGIMFGAD